MTNEGGLTGGPLASTVHTPRRSLGWAAWALLALSLAILVVAAFFLITTRDVAVTTQWGFRGYASLLAVPFAVIGALVASRHQHNPIGWIMSAVGLISALQMLVEEYAVYASSSGAGGATSAEWVGHWIWLPGVALFGTAVLIFPTGAVPSRRWRPVLWLIVLGTLVTLAAFMVGDPEVMGVSGTNVLAVETLSDYASPAANVGSGLLYAGLLLAVASVVVRMRRSSGEQRQQMKWLVFGAAMLPIANAIATLPLAPMVRNLAICGLSAFPVSMGIAMLKYRLYDIDVVVNRALVYATLTGLLAATYFGTVVVLQAALQDVTEGSNIAVAASTLAVAALFNPLRLRVQRFIDARFYRRKYNAIQAIEDFATHLRHDVDLAALSPRLLSAVGETVGPTSASLWLREPAAARD